MVELLQELSQLPRAFAQMLEDYLQGEGRQCLTGLSRPSLPLLTGMGASYHVAWIGAQMCHRLGLPALYVEATDLLNYSSAVLQHVDQVVYISQSGSSGEVLPFLQRVDRPRQLVGMTNHLESALAQQANCVLPMLAGEEHLIASKTYVNSLAILWLATQVWAGHDLDRAFDTLLLFPKQIEEVQEHSQLAQKRLVDMLLSKEQVVFLGHGPHAATARDASMTLSEWPKIASQNYSLGAFRHGFIETVTSGTGVVIFAPAGRTQGSAIALGEELASYGAQVLLIENGYLRGLDEPTLTQPLPDEFLSPILDILPIQICAETLARQSGRAPGFRYISKVVSQL